MKTAWYGSEKARLRYCPELENISEQSQLDANCCVVWIDPSNDQTFNWFEGQLRIESVPKTWLLISIAPLTEIITHHSWLHFFQHHFLSLPLDQPEQLKQKLKPLQPLPETELVKLRQKLFEESFERLCHDAAKDLINWPKRQTQLEAHIKRFAADIPFGYASLLKTIQNLLTQIEQLSSQNIWQAIQNLSTEPVQSLKTNDLNLATERQKLKSIIRHWQALPEKLKRLKLGLPAINYHQTLTLNNQSTNIDATEIQDLANQLQALTELDDYPKSDLSRLCHNTIEQHVFHILDELEALGLTQDHLSLETVENYLAKLGPEPLAEKVKSATVKKPKRGPLHIIVVENEASWQASILDILNLVCRSHGWTEQQVVFGTQLCATSRQQAQELIKQHRNSPMLVITDLSIPETELSEPHPEVGEALLKYLLSAGQNLPLLLLTTPQHALTEQRRLTQLGFNQVDFVLKLRLDQLSERIEEWLTQQMEASFSHKIEINDRFKTVKIDHINIQLGKVSFALLNALANKHQEGTRFYDQSTLIANDEDLRDALSEQNDAAGFSKSLYQLKKELLKGMSESERYLMLSEMIEDSQDQIGRKTFRISPQNQVKILDGNENLDIEFNDDLDEDQLDQIPIEANNWNQPKLLIVEDEAAWAKDIADLANEMGFICQQASTIEAAKLALNSFKPDLLTLDLQLPQREGEEAFESGGFEVLQQARELNPAIRIVMPSTHYRRGALVSQAAKLQVPLMDFVPKGASIQGVSWLVYLYNRLRHHRLELQQLNDQADTFKLLPPLNLHVTDSDKNVMIEVNGQLWSASSHEAKLLKSLSQKAGQWVIIDDLYEAIYDSELSADKRHEKFEQVLKRARQIITRQWLKGQVKDKMGLHLLERQGQRFCLHVNSI